MAKKKKVSKAVKARKKPKSNLDSIDRLSEIAGELQLLGALLWNQMAGESLEYDDAHTLGMKLVGFSHQMEADIDRINGT